LNNDFNDGIALWGGYIDFNCQTVDGASQGYRNNIFSFQRYGTEIAFINSNSVMQSNGDMRAPIFYDSNNTGFYMDPNSTAADCVRIAGGIHVSVGNTTGHGIILADDGDIVDLNDGYCAMRFSSGVRIHSGNRAGGPVITLGSNGVVSASTFSGTLSGNASDINTSNITRAPQYGGQNFNNLTGFSFCASAVADANGPFGNGFWYNIVNVRHQGGVGDGNVWGLQIAAGMTNQARRIAFRTQVAGNWEPWGEFSHSQSDATLKIEDGFIENGIDLVMRLKPRYYYWKHDKLNNPERRAGFFAQEVHEISPESAIQPADESMSWGVEDRGLIALLTKAIQEQQVLIQQMQEEINNLKNR
jgi:hypothetical protein